MKPRLSKQKGLNLLKRNEKLLPDSIYLIGSESIAKNLYFKKKENLETMHKKIKQHIKIVADILEYVFTPYGFILMIKTKNKNQIKTEYELLQRRKNKPVRYSTASKIISEQIRLAISTGNKQINIENRKSGSLSHSNFFRCISKEYKILKRVIEKIKVGLITLCRQNRRYRSIVQKWNEGGMVCAGDLGIEGGEGNSWYLIDLQTIKDHVGQKHANYTYKAHFNPT